MYRHFFKPLLDFILSLLAVIVLSPFFLLFTPIVAIAMKGNPFFVQPRPGKNGKIFRMIKYRTMTNAKDENGNLLPDADRLTCFGKTMRKLSIDELPEIFNILAGQMSIVGPRPQLIKDLVFFDEETMNRQSVRPGLTGWAQVNGRNNVTWEHKFELDAYYIEHMSLWLDIKILFMTVFKVFARKDINTEGMETAEDYGDCLLREGKIEKEYYDRMCDYAALIKTRRAYNADIIFGVQKTVPQEIDYCKYSFLMTVYIKTNIEYLKQSVKSMLDQTVPAEQIVIVCDGPVSEEVGEYLNKLSEDEPQLWTIVRLRENAGQGLAARAGMEQCRNQLIARMDDDDVSVVDRIEKQIAFLKEHRDVDVLGGNIEEFIGDESNVVGVRAVPSSHEEILKYQRSRCPMNQITTLMLKYKVEMAGGYQHWHFDEDSYLWARMNLAGCRFANLTDILCHVRVGKDMYRRRGGYKYYQSERDLFKFMYKNGIITYSEYVKAKFIRFVVQVLMPNGVRQWFFKTFARESK